MTASIPLSTVATLDRLHEFRGILFDLDGTLIDHETAAWVGAQRFSAEQGVDPDPQLWMDIEAKWFAAFERGEVDHAGQRRARVREYLHKPSLSDDEAMALFDVYRRHYADAWERYDDALPALSRAVEFARRASGTVAVFTNGAAELQTDKLVRCGLNLDGIVMIAAAELGVAKPQPQSYLLASQAIGIRIDECVLIGDNPTNDVSGAHEVGMAAIYLDRHHDTPDSITSLDALRWQR